MSETIAWVDHPGPGGSWGDPDRLCLPLSDRGLLLADGLFETVLVEEGTPRLLEEHLRRWRDSAALLALPPPPDHGRVESLLDEAVARSGVVTGALRLNWSRGSGCGRGIDPAVGASGPRFWLQLSCCRPRFDPLTVIVSRSERRNAESLLSRCKTFAYGPAVQARREALLAAADDALLLSTSGELCCGTTASLLLRRDGRWQTPPLASGCLPGVMRGRALASGVVREARLELADLHRAEAALLINSLGCRPIRRCGERELPVPTAEAVEAFWRGLLMDGEAAQPW